MVISIKQIGDTNPTIDLRVYRLPAYTSHGAVRII